MVKESIHTKQVITTLVIGKMMYFMVMDHIFFNQGRDTKVNFQMETKMEKELTIMKMEMFIKAIGKMT